MPKLLPAVSPATSALTATEPPRAISRSRTVAEILVALIPNLGLIAIPFVSPTAVSFALCAAVMLMCGFGVTVCHHRYFAHRSFKTSRWFQFVLGWWASATGQRGPLWWSAHHRRHHSHSDTEGDVHSPTAGGFLHAHLGWLFGKPAAAPDFRVMRDFAKFPELVWLDRLWAVPFLLVGFACYLIGGWAGVVYGFCLGCAIVLQITFSINSFAHLFGKQPHPTGDSSRNNWLLGVIGFGEGWHNNHHHSPRTARLGVKWNQIDFGYWMILVLEKLGLIWCVRKTPRPPRGERHSEG